MECFHIKELNIEHTICHLIRYIYMYLMILSSQQMTKVITFLSNPQSLVPCEDLLTLLLHLQTKKYLTDKFYITLQHNVTR